MTIESSSVPRVLLVISFGEHQYVARYRQAMAGISCHMTDCPILVSSLGALLLLRQERQFKHVITTDPRVFKLFDIGFSGSQEDGWGSSVTREGITCTLIPPLTQLHSVPHSIFLHRHYLTKAIGGGIQLLAPRFSFSFVEPHTLADILEQFRTAILCSVDIETAKLPDIHITSVAWTILQQDGSSASFALPWQAGNIEFALQATKLLNATPCAKILQNGMYDSLYFVTFNCPLVNWRYDTYHLMHSMYSELPKTLHFIAGFTLTNYTYWKQLGKTELYKYNALDTHNTLFAFLGLALLCAQKGMAYVLPNYAEEFANVIPALSCDLEGLMVDEPTRLAAREVAVQQQQEAQQALELLIGQQVNAQSSQQVAKLLRTFVPDLKSTDKGELAKLAEKSPIAGRIIKKVQQIRQAGKAISTYFDMELKDGRLFYHLDPGGTETTRFASKSSGYWCGTQIQNIPSYARGMCVFEPGWVGIACDKKQSESYCTAYLSRDSNLKHTVNTSPDFHSANASYFFGIPFEDIWDVEGGFCKLPKIRKLAKTINHGVSYNMGANVLLGNMGHKAVLEAQHLLGYPAQWTPLRVCEELLATFDRRYPNVRGSWQGEVVKEVADTGCLRLPTGHVRKTFLKPWGGNKPHLNACIANCPQGLSVQLVNKAFRKVYWQLQLGKYLGKFRLKAQVHDEIVAIVRPEVMDEALEDLANMMVVPWTIHGEVMSIPSSKAHGSNWGKLK